MTPRRAGTNSDHRVNMVIEKFLTYESQKAPYGPPSPLPLNPSSSIGHQVSPFVHGLSFAP